MAKDKRAAVILGEIIRRHKKDDTVVRTSYKAVAVIATEGDL
jgi:hypothetical protein